MHQAYIAVDLVKVYKSRDRKPSNLLTVLAWGDVIDILEEKKEYIKIGLSGSGNSGVSLSSGKREGFILLPSKNRSVVVQPLSKKDVLMVSYVDVQQGDGCVIETPDGKTILIDGGENQMFARYLAARFSGSTPENPKVIDCIVVTHGDADHFVGLPRILESEQNSEAKKRLYIKPLRVYHNGIIKGPSTSGGKKTADKNLFGKTALKDGHLYVTELHDDLLQVADKEMNGPFRTWKKALAAYANFYGPITIQRLDNQSENAFAFVNNINIEVLGPMTEMVNGKKALKFLRTPPKSAAKSIAHENNGSYSASHTINGHSIILRLIYGNVRFFFAGDLNEEAENLLVQRAGTEQQSFQSEILKVPHHGSADFSDEFLQAVDPLISIVSSGDESEQKEYIHPRATLMGALGKHSRISRPLIFVTEMVAFFKKEGLAQLRGAKESDGFFAFSRSAFGIVHVRTDGRRILVFTHSGKQDLKEAYAFTIEGVGCEPQRADVVIM